jgi:alanine dehydrogenase
MAATSSIVPVIKAGWLREGVHVSYIKIHEVDSAVIDQCHRVFTHTSLQEKPVLNELPGTLHMPREYKDGWWNEEGRKQTVFPDISDLATGTETGRTDDREITCFINNVGIGLQFAALGALILEKAKGLGLGTELPAEWFSETVHP